MVIYEQEQVVQAFKIYSTLAINGKANKDDLRLYIADDTIRGLVNQFAQEMDCIILVVGDMVYMVPLAIYSPFHVSNQSIKDKHLPSKAVNADIYMMYISIIILFGEFYDSYQNVEATRDFIRVGDWLNVVNQKVLSIKTFDEEKLLELEERYEYNWIAIIDKWDALDDIKENVAQTARTISRMSFINMVKRFLEKQELVEEIGNDEIQLTEKAKAIIQRYYMELEHNREILEFIYSLEGKEGEENASHIKN
ncbi:non-ribosomal peptide synthetase module [Tissierella sp. DSM 105185]|uniref:Non-ribosomal peptide synthetase module n=1 Tax=Tissierella pigra TaxID=2607614 RepID=A0A6N7Y2H4_9FIRM|nr:non-ribosomal peptide synthetase module [Tissierella pigra]